VFVFHFSFTRLICTLHYFSKFSRGKYQKILKKTKENGEKFKEIKYFEKREKDNCCMTGKGHKLNIT